MSRLSISSSFLVCCHVRCSLGGNLVNIVLREEATLGDEQVGFMPGRGTTDAIFAVRQHMEKHREKQKGLNSYGIYRLRKGIR